MIVTVEGLKPCPFCGGEAYLNSENNSHLVYCCKCTTHTGDYNDPEGPVKLWNNRVRFIRDSKGKQMLISEDKLDKIMDKLI